jgi:hypothetical protein
VTGTGPPATAARSPGRPGSSAELPPTKPRLAAIIALVLGALTFAAALYATIADLGRGLILSALLIGAAIAAWHGLLRRRVARLTALATALLLALAAVLYVIVDAGVLELALIATGAAATVAATKAVFAVHLPLPEAADPLRPVLFLNPRSGGGKAERHELQPPLRFGIRAGVLRMRIARAHPGGSPSRALPESTFGTVAALLAIAAGRQPR